MTCTRQRDSSAEFSSNDGFSVVAPTNRITPFSMCGRNASCCALLKRCTSSTNSTLRMPCAKLTSASASASRTSARPDSTAEIARKPRSRISPAAAPASSCRSRAAPTGSSNSTLPASIARRSGVPAPSRRCWPTISSSVAGRMRSASGFRCDGSANSSGVDAVFRRAIGRSYPARPAPPTAPAPVLRRGDGLLDADGRGSARRDADRAIRIPDRFCPCWMGVHRYRGKSKTKRLSTRMHADKAILNHADPLLSVLIRAHPRQECSSHGPCTAARIPLNRAIGDGGQPGTTTSTGMTLDTAPALA